MKRFAGNIRILPESLHGILMRKIVAVESILQEFFGKDGELAPFRKGTYPHFPILCVNQISVVESIALKEAMPKHQRWTGNHVFPNPGAGIININCNIKPGLMLPAGRDLAVAIN